MTFWATLFGYEFMNYPMLKGLNLENYLAKECKLTYSRPYIRHVEQFMVSSSHRIFYHISVYSACVLFFATVCRWLEIQGTVDLHKLMVVVILLRLLCSACLHGNSWLSWSHEVSGIVNYMHTAVEPCFCMCWLGISWHRFDYQLGIKLFVSESRY